MIRKRKNNKNMKTTFFLFGNLLLKINGKGKAKPTFFLGRQMGRASTGSSHLLPVSLDKSVFCIYPIHARVSVILALAGTNDIRGYPHIFLQKKI